MVDGRITWEMDHNGKFMKKQTYYVLINGRKWFTKYPVDNGPVPNDTPESQNATTSKQVEKSLILIIWISDRRICGEELS